MYRKWNINAFTETQRTRQEYSLDEVLSIDSEGNEMILSDIISSNETLALTKMTEEEDVKIYTMQLIN